MNRTNLVFGITLLLIAAAVAVLRTDDAEEPVLSRNEPAERTHWRGNSPLRLTTALYHPARTRPAPGRDLPVIETFLVEPLAESHPALEARAQRVQNGARNRLEELIDGLDLTERQQIEIFPLLARSHPDYDRNLHLVGVPVSSTLDPLGKFAANRQIEKILSYDQQLELEIMAASADVWWTDVIARLERDLVDSTKEPVAAGKAPEHDPTPPKEDPPPAPRAIVPSNSRGSNENNLFDLLQQGGS